jgi:hypothetical protein
MGDRRKRALRVRFDGKLRLDFHGARITSDAELLPLRELDEAFRLTEAASIMLSNSRRGKNTQHTLLASLRQVVYGRLAGYENVNDAKRPACRSGHAPSCRRQSEREGNHVHQRDEPIRERMAEFEGEPRGADESPRHMDGFCPGMCATQGTHQVKAVERMDSRQERSFSLESSGFVTVN